jgi:hypothetical protein
MHAAKSKELTPTLQEGKTAVTNEVVQVPYRYRALQCAAGYRSTVHCVALLYNPLALPCS